MQPLQPSIDAMKQRIANILDSCTPSIYLYGSFVLDDFRFGWSDIDILVITERKISEEQAQQLVGLRQKMLEEEPQNPYYRSFEGGMLTLDAFLSGNADTVVYWGTSGERIMDKYNLDAFCMTVWLDNGILLYGNDIRDHFAYPSYDERKANVQRHYETIRQYARKTGRSFYSFGWLLDISRCIYTLRTGNIISKTAAGEWALKEKLCPCENALKKAVEIRKEPNKHLNSLDSLDYAERLEEDIQRYADILEQELSKQKG